VGKHIDVNGRNLSICKQLGEGGFSFVYLVRDKEGGVTDRDSTLGSRGGDRDGDDATPNLPLHHNQQPRQPPNAHPKAFKHSGNSHPDHVSTNSTQTTNQIQISPPYGTPMVLKITSVHTKNQRQMAEKEAKLLQQLSHPSIIQVYDHGFRDPSTSLGGGTSCDDLPLSAPPSSTSAATSSSNIPNSQNANGQLPLFTQSKPTQHMILMEYCEGGTAFDAIKRMRASLPSPQQPLSFTNHMNITPSQRFDLPSLVISFGQICNAVSYLHAQRPPIVHRDLKPVNFLIKNGAYKLCDFGSAVMGHTDLRTPENRRKAEEVVQKTTTQMFRAPEMVDLYMAKKLTQSTDVWAMGCCLYSMAFLRDCFEEGSNLAILSRKYKIPDDNPYGDGLVDLIDRMLTVDCKERADMSEVIMCLSALYSNRPFPKRKRRTSKPREEVKNEETRVGAYRTDGQGIRPPSPEKQLKKKSVEAKKLNPNSAAAKRKKASEGQKQKELTPAYQIPTPDSANSGFQDYGEGIDKSTSSSIEFSDSGFGNFASFHQTFEKNFDPFESGNENNIDDVFPVSKAFDEQCQISNASSQSVPDLGDTTNGDDLFQSGVADAFEVTFQGFGNPPTTFPVSGGNREHSDFFDSRNSGAFVGMNARKTSSFAQPIIGHLDMNNRDSLNGKKKRGIFSMLGKK